MNVPAPYRPIRAGATCTLPTENHLQETERTRLLTRYALWNNTHLLQLETTKQFIVGKQKTLPPLSAYGNNFYDRNSMGWWDAYRRITMLEPLAADVLFPTTP